ncbi:MAG: nucleotide modification associated domain-containing protein [Paraclostridium sp.]
MNYINCKCEDCFFYSHNLAVCTTELLCIENNQYVHGLTIEEIRDHKENRKVKEYGLNVDCLSCCYYNAGDGCERVMCIHKENELKEELKPTSYFEDITAEMFELYQVKNKNYGNSFSEQFKDYGMTSVCIRLDDKIRRLKSLNKQGTEGTNEESIRDTLIDTAVYSVLAIIELDKN